MVMTKVHMRIIPFKFETRLFVIIVVLVMLTQIIKVDKGFLICFDIDNFRECGEVGLYAF